MFPKPIQEWDPRFEQIGSLGGHDARIERDSGRHHRRGSHPEQDDVDGEDASATDVMNEFFPPDEVVNAMKSINIPEAINEEEAQGSK